MVPSSRIRSQTCNVLVLFAPQTHSKPENQPHPVPFAQRDLRGLAGLDEADPLRHRVLRRAILREVRQLLAWGKLGSSSGGGVGGGGGGGGGDTGQHKMTRLDEAPSSLKHHEGLKATQGQKHPRSFNRALSARGSCAAHGVP